MYTHDYSDELHVKRNDKQVPMSIGIVLFGVLLVAVWFGYRAAEAHVVAQEQAMAQAK